MLNETRAQVDLLNNCTLDCEEEDPFADSKTRILITVLFIVEFICAFFGNLIVLYLFLKCKRLRTTTNILVGNLIFAEFLVSICCLIPTLLDIVYHIPGHFLMCKVKHYAQEVTNKVSILTLIAICIERYIAVVKPLEVRDIITFFRLKIIILSIWSVELVYHLPLLYYYELIEIQGYNVYICTIEWDLDKYFDLLNTIVFYIIPLVLMTFVYFKISFVVFYRQKNLPPANKTLLNRNEKTWLKGCDNTSSCMDLTYHVECDTKTSKQQKNGIDRELRETQVVINGKSENPNGYKTTKLLDEQNSLKKIRNKKPKNRSNSILDIKNRLKASKKSMENFNENGLSKAVKSKQNIKKFTQSSIDLTANCSIELSSRDSYNDLSILQKNYTKRPSRSGSLKQQTKLAHILRKNKCQSRYRTLLLMIVIVVIFALTTLPYQFQVIMSKFGIWQEMQSTTHFKLFVVISFLLYYANAGLNCFLYALISKQFRECMVKRFTYVEKCMRKNS